MAHSQSTPAERDALFAVLADPRRRRLLELLEHLEPGRRTTLSDLSERLAAAEESTEREQRQNVAVTLRHVHLPKLDDAGLVEYDPETNVVETVDRTDDRAELGRAMPATEE
ncbi:DUF7344 domain-containing protein [Halosimplex amylolyticum]|uniref:DUF7344 domain-containing protein n=1 Tax=Halosimplex amylolyticum TaxID=3396616 RepID=UPI003F568C53